MVAESEMDNVRATKDAAENGAVGDAEPGTGVGAPNGAGRELQASRADGQTEVPTVLLDRDLRTLLALLVVSGLALAALGAAHFFRRNGRG